jgi:hypothetical protein
MGELETNAFLHRCVLDRKVGDLGDVIRFPQEHRWKNRKTGEQVRHQVGPDSLP